MGKRKKITERFQIFDAKEADRINEALKSLGYRDDYDYYVQEVFRFEYDFMARGYAIGLEDERDDLQWEAWDDVDYEDVIHTDKDSIGFTITNTDNESLDINEIMRWVNRKELRVDCCAVCGKRIAVNKKYLRDRRKEDDGLKCFDHRGIGAVKIEEEIDLMLKEKKKRPLPIRNKPVPAHQPELQQQPQLKPQTSLLKFTDWMPKASNENLYIR
jgi:hypothetical protein